MPIISLNGLELEKMLTFSLGRAYIGCIPDSFNSTFNIDIISFSNMGYNVFNRLDLWASLTPKYKCEWPQNLVLSDQVLEKFGNLFRLFFPIKKVNWRLRRAWIGINYCMKESGDVDQEVSWNYLSSLRNKMGYFLNGVWGYFYTDVLEVQWRRLTDKLGDMGKKKVQIFSPNEEGFYPQQSTEPNPGKLKEFEDLRKAIKSYLEAIYIQTFLNFPQMIRSLFSIIQHCKQLATYVELIEAGDRNIYDMEKPLKTLQINFHKDVTFFIRMINNLNQAGSSQFLSQLLMRLNYNHFYQLSEMECD